MYLNPWSLYTSIGYGSFNQLSQKFSRDWDYSAPYEINLGSRYSDQIYNSKSIVDLGLSYSKYVGFFSGPTHSESRALLRFFSFHASYGRKITVLKASAEFVPSAGLELGLQNTRKEWISGMGEIENYEAVNKLRIMVPLQLDANILVGKNIGLGFYIRSKFAKPGNWIHTAIPEIYTNAGINIRVFFFRRMRINF